MCSSKYTIFLDSEDFVVFKTVHKGLDVTGKVWRRVSFTDICAENDIEVAGKPAQYGAPFAPKIGWIIH